MGLDPCFSFPTHQGQGQVKVRSLSHAQLFVTPWTVAYQALLSMGFSRQEYWSGLPFPSPGDLPNSGTEPESPALQPDALTSEPPGKPITVRSIINNTPVPRPPQVPSSYRVFYGSIYSFPLVRYSCLLSTGVLHALLCLEVYS